MLGPWQQNILITRNRLQSTFSTPESAVMAGHPSASLLETTYSVPRDNALLIRKSAQLRCHCLARASIESVLLQIILLMTAMLWFLLTPGLSLDNQDLVSSFDDDILIPYTLITNAPTIIGRANLYSSCTCNDTYTCGCVCGCVCIDKNKYKQSQD